MHHAIKVQLDECYRKWKQYWSCPFCGTLDPTKQFSLSQRINTEIDIKGNPSDFVPVPLEIKGKITIEKQPESIYHYKCIGCQPERNFYDISTIDIDNILKSLKVLDSVNNNKYRIYDRHCSTAKDIMEIDQLVRCYRTGVSRLKQTIILKSIRQIGKTLKIIKDEEDHTYITLKYKNIRSQLVCVKVKSATGEHYVAKDLEPIV